MTITYEDIVPALVGNTTMRKMLVDGVDRVYTIKANDGYLLHDKELDFYPADENGDMSTEVTTGFTPAQCSCAASYDFTANPREFYAVLESSVPADQIFSDNNEPEIM